MNNKGGYIMIKSNEVNSVKKSEYVTAEKFKASDLLHKEDWLTIWGGFIIIFFAAVGVLTEKFAFKGVKIPTWGGGDNPGILGIFTKDTLSGIIFTFAVLAIIFTAGKKLEQKSSKKFFIGFIGIFLITTVVRIISAQVTLNKYLEFAFWALLIGLIIANTVRTPEWLKPAIQTEFYIKTGLVIMGAEVLFSNIQKFGLYGLGIAWGVTPVVIIFMWILGTKILKIENKSLVMTLAAATSVCGTSAAIATAASCKAKKTDLTFAVGISLIFTVVMMVSMPLFIKLIEMDPMIGGAWIGGTVDSTGAVVLAGQALGDLGGTVAALVKMIQNILIGFIAFAVAIFFTTKVDKTNQNTVGISEVWNRFPKFILGFIGASLIFSFIVQPVVGTETTSAIISNLGQFKTWAFALAFTSIGLETNFSELKEQFKGGKPLTLYIVGQTFNLILTLLVVWLLLSGRIFPVPNISV